MIASEMSPLKQQAWQDCRAFLLRGVHQARLFIMHPLLLTIPLTHVMGIMGLMVSRLEWAVRARSHLVSSGLFFRKDPRMNWVIFLMCLLRTSVPCFETFVKDDTWSTFYPVWENITSSKYPSSSVWLMTGGVDFRQAKKESQLMRMKINVW